MPAPTLEAVVAAKVKRDAVLTSQASIDVARAALGDIARPADVGEFVGATMEGERLATLAFECLQSGYRGWYWAVTLTRVPRARTATVCETELLPGDDALLARDWLPWSERLRPGDLGAGDVLPRVEHDDRLVPGYAATDSDIDEVALWELGLGRERVLSPEGRREAATRWYNGDSGPKSPIAVKAKAPCSTCGFFVPMAGSWRAVFGVCANEWSPSDGRVVSLDHGCGAHSQTDVPATPSEWPAMEPLLDDGRVEMVDLAARPDAEVGAGVDTGADAAAIASPKARTKTDSPRGAETPDSHGDAARLDVLAELGDLLSASGRSKRSGGATRRATKPRADADSTPAADASAAEPGATSSAALGEGGPDPEADTGAATADTLFDLAVESTGGVDSAVGDTATSETVADATVADETVAGEPAARGRRRGGMVRRLSQAIAGLVATPVRDELPRDAQSGH